jgi:pimeloyl-ACP methyl ester carboxylesterase
MRPWPPVIHLLLRQHPDVATALIYTTEDECFTPEWERFVAEQLLRVAPIHLACGHFPMVENADLLAENLDGLAVDAVGPPDVT